MVRIVTSKQLQKHLDHHWNDVCAPEERIDAKHMKGLCDPGVSRIFINKDLHRTEEDLRHTYFHELFHAILFADGQSGHDEEFVDRVGGLLHQYEETKKWRQ